MRAAEFLIENKNHSAVAELKAALLDKKDQIQSATDDDVYDIIDRMMTRIAKSHDISGKELHDLWVDEYKQIPDKWIMKEDADNTADIELNHEPTNTGGVEVHAYRDGQEVGWVRFSRLKTGQVKAAMVHVPERFRRQGVASAMYRYARQELGLDIVPSDSQTDQGRAFWNKVHENFTTEAAIEATDLVDVYIRGKHKGETITRLVARAFPNQQIPLLIRRLERDHGVNPSAVVYGPSRVMNENETNNSTQDVVFLGPDAVIVGQEHGKKLKLSPEIAKKVKDIAERHGAWYEGNGMDQKLTRGIIDDYEGSWDDDLLSPAIKGYPAPFLYVLFSNIKENDTVEGKIGFDPESTIFDRILDTQPSANYFPDRTFDADTLRKFLRSVSDDSYDFVELSQLPATEKNVRKFFTLGEQLMFPDNWEEYPYRAGRVAKSVNDLRDRFLASRKQGVYVAGSDHLKAVQQFLDQPVTENFADGKIKDKSRPGRVKRAGASCAGSVTELRKRAKNASGERAKMYHWCANMKSGRKK